MALRVYLVLETASWMLLTGRRYEHTYEVLSTYVVRTWRWSHKGLWLIEDRLPIFRCKALLIKCTLPTQAIAHTAFPKLVTPCLAVVWLAVRLSSRLAVQAGVPGVAGCRGCPLYGSVGHLGHANELLKSILTMFHFLLQ